MSRTKGSGWGNGRKKLFQYCPRCGKKKAYYNIYSDPEVRSAFPFRCMNCKESFKSDVLKRQYDVD